MGNGSHSHQIDRATEEIWISDADGSNPRQMTSMKGPLCANPRWSPDGRTILFSSRRDGPQDLYLLSPDTGGVRRITDDPGQEFEARWSRDGRSIYFGSRRTGEAEVWKMDAGGGPAVRITRHGGISATVSRKRTVCVRSSWSWALRQLVDKHQVLTRQRFDGIGPCDCPPYVGLAREGRDGLATPDPSLLGSEPGCCELWTMSSGFIGRLSSRP
jgi:tricorn protease-like protein